MDRGATFNMIADEDLWKAPRVDTHLYTRADVVVFEYKGRR
jgi:hypothetical protein